MFRSVLLSVLLALGSFSASAQSLSEMAGQMVMVGFSGDRPDAAGVVAVREQIARGEIGGVMYLRSNIASLLAVRAINQSLVAAAEGPAPFIALDQEGGQVERLTNAVGFTEIASAREVARAGVAAAQGIYADLALRLAAQGFSVNFGPVVDLEINRANPVIARFGRAFGSDPAMVSALASVFVEGHRGAGVATALKHFPGHGSSLGDTHEGFVDVTAQWSAIELEPFAALIDAGQADMVMVAHIYHAGYDGDEELPASLSPDWIGGVLRGDLGYDGVVVSDDMEMGAIRERFGLRDTIIRAVRAGNDVLLFSNTAAYDPALGSRIHEILIEEAQADPAFAARIAQSYARIIVLKRALGLA